MEHASSTVPGRIEASAPGSLMLAGEHAVLRGAHALVAAVSARMHVTLTPRTDRLWRVKSVLGEETATMDIGFQRPVFRFVQAALRHSDATPSTGLDLVIRSDFEATLGLGSSAAITVALLAALRAHRGLPPDPAALLEAAVTVIRAVQGAGSGADAAASVYGGLVLYRTRPLKVERLETVPALTIIYSGHKTPTPEVIRRLEPARQTWPDLFGAWDALSDRVVLEAFAAARREDWTAFGRLMNFNHGLLEALGVGTPELAAIVYALRATPGILGAKLSGAGLGDCAIGLGAPPAAWQGPGTRVDATLSPDGVRAVRQELAR